MLRSTILTFRMHRFEVFAVTVGMTLMAVSAWVVYQHLLEVRVPPDCWGRWIGGGGQVDATCRRLVNAFFGVRGEAGSLTGTVSFAFPLAVGVVLGVPVVGREIELRTSSLAWSLSGARSRWLLQRFLPLLALALVGLAVGASLLSGVWRTSVELDELPRLGDLGMQGPTMVARGFMALGAALLVGTVVGRTLPSLIVASVVVLGVVNLGTPTVQSVLARVYRVWVVDGGTDQEAPALVSFASGWRTSDGRFLNSWQARHVFREQCPGCKGSYAWLEQRMQHASRIVPIERYGEFALAETAWHVGVGGLAMLLTFPVVARRRPA